MSTISHSILIPADTENVKFGQIRGKFGGKLGGIWLKDLTFGRRMCYNIDTLAEETLARESLPLQLEFSGTLYLRYKYRERGT